MPLSWDIQSFPSLPSTQDFCKGQAALGAAEGLVVQTHEQTAGRGRHGRVWQSGAGNLMFSCLLRPKVPVEHVGQLALISGVVLARILKEALSERADLRLKWPNDILIERRKCAGILLESDLTVDQRLGWVVMGIGVNLGSAPDFGAAVNAYIRDPLTPETLLQAFLGEFSLAYEAWKSKGFEGFRADWRDLSFPKGTALNVGAFEDLDAMGNLIVRGPENTLKTISAGDVFVKDYDYAAGH